MLVDDHASFRASARWLLETEGYDVVAEAASGESALEPSPMPHPSSCCLTSGFRASTAFRSRSRSGRASPRPHRADLEPRPVRPRRGSRDRLRRRRLRAQGGALARRARGRHRSPRRTSPLCAGSLGSRRHYAKEAPWPPPRPARSRTSSTASTSSRSPAATRTSSTRPPARSTRRHPSRASEDVDRAYAAASARLRGVARLHARRAPARAAALRRRDRVARGRVRRRRGREHRQAARAHGLGGDPADGRPDPLLRGRRARARGPLGRRVHARHDVVHPPRADRRRRPGHALELPAADGDLEDRPGARRGQQRSCSSRATRRPSRRC